MEPRVCREHGLFPLPAGKRGGVRGFTIEGLGPPHPQPSPRWERQSCVPQIEAVPITKVWNEMNGACSSRPVPETEVRRMVEFAGSVFNLQSGW
jgi:hypothetical protein